MTKSVARLYEQFQPEHYQLQLAPDRDSMTFSGTVTIHGKKLGRPSERLTFHQSGLKISAAQVIKHDKQGDKTLEISRTNTQETLNELRIHTTEKVYPGEYTVTLDFSGKITKDMHGIYPCFYTHDGQAKKLIATQFESHHAREAFPCIDEPEAKATFELALAAPTGETVLSNTPVRTELPEGESTIYIFERTPKMSTYLLAFVYGELGYTESKTKTGVVVRSYATPDNAPDTTYSVEVAAKILDFFGEYFDVPYPLQKLDMVALPDFTVGAMENWGLVTFREQTMIVKEDSASIESRQLVALVVSHELSHQWFGNLVTMKWWDDLWLNESFANMMEYRAVDDVHPEWKIWEQFISHEQVAAKRRDALLDVQSVRTGVHHPDEINTIFDPSIVYAKGGSLLYMLLNHIGEDNFRRGLAAYFKQHSYGNTEAEDLWKALAKTSGTHVSAFMNKWLHKPGYPIVSVNWQPDEPTVSLSQQRFLSNPTVTSDDNEPWHVPLASNLPLSDELLTQSTLESTLQSTPSKQPLLLNHDGASYFLPYYAEATHLQMIVQALQRHEVSDIDRFTLLDNYQLLQRGGISATTELLDLVSAYTDESSETVWGALAMSFGEVRRLIEGDEAAEKKLDSIIATLVLPLSKQLGWDDAPDDSPQTLRLRGLVLSLAAGAKVQSIIDEGLQRFAAFTKPSDLSASTRSIVYFTGARYGTDADFQKLLSLHEIVQNADEKEEIAGGLTSTKDEGHIATLLQLLQSESVRRQDALHWYVWLIRNRYARNSTWQWTKKNWHWIEAEFGSDKTYSYFPRYCGGTFTRNDELAAFNEFFGPMRSTIALGHEIMLAEQEIQSRVAWREANEASTKAWLKKS